MKRIGLLFFVFVLCGASFIKAQSTDNLSKSKNALPGKYDRNSLTVILVEKTQDYQEDVSLAMDKMKVPDKFDDHMVPTRKLIVNSAVEIANLKISNQVVAKWFSRSEDGSFDVALLQERGLYNATDDDVLKAQATKRGNAALEDAGEKLLSNSYILVLEYTKIMPYEVWKAMQQQAVSALGTLAGVDLGGGEIRKNGWMGLLKAHLYQMDWSDSVAAVFWQELWVSKGDDPKMKTERKAKFDNFNFPVKFIMSVDALGDGSQYNASVPLLAPPVQKTREELFVQMNEMAVESAAEAIERKFEPWRVKMPVYATGPITSKVGLKEGITCDKRFYVLEYQLDDSGNKIAKRKGVIRVRKTVDNRQMATGKTDLFSKFYQTSGGSIEPGMLLQQRNDFGLGISVGYGVGEIGGLNLKGEYNVSKILGKAFKEKWSVTQLKLWVSLGMESRNDYKDNLVVYNPWGSIDGKDISFLRYEVGISKGWYFLRNFSFAPYIGAGMETATLDGVDDETVGTLLVNMGGVATVNLTHFLQIYADAHLNLPTLAMDKDNNTIQYNDSNGDLKDALYTDMFLDRTGLTLNFGLRVEL